MKGLAYLLAVSISAVNPSRKVILVDFSDSKRGTVLLENKKTAITIPEILISMGKKFWIDTYRIGDKDYIYFELELPEEDLEEEFTAKDLVRAIKKGKKFRTIPGDEFSTSGFYKY